jgi:hypothetical protein
VRAHKRLSSAHHAAPHKAYRIVRESLVMYFADKLNGSVGTLQDEHIELAMQQSILDERLQMQILACLALADEGLYAPFEAARADALVKNSMKLLAAVDAQWKAGE